MCNWDLDNTLWDGTLIEERAVEFTPEARHPRSD